MFRKIQIALIAGTLLGVAAPANATARSGCPVCGCTANPVHCGASIPSHLACPRAKLERQTLINYGPFRVSDGRVREALNRIAALNAILGGGQIIVTSGDRSHVPPGGSRTSDHLFGRAVDFRSAKLSDGQLFQAIRAKAGELFPSDGSFQVIFHGPATATSSPHIHVGRNPNGFGTSFLVEGATPATRGKYSRVP
jgi:hypothetical protein